MDDFAREVERFTRDVDFDQLSDLQFCLGRKGDLLWAEIVRHDGLCVGVYLYRGSSRDVITCRKGALRWFRCDESRMLFALKTWSKGVGEWGGVKIQWVRVVSRQGSARTRPIQHTGSRWDQVNLPSCPCSLSRAFGRRNLLLSLPALAPNNCPIDSVHDSDARERHEHTVYSDDDDK